MRTFILFDAGDYMGCSPDASVIKIPAMKTREDEVWAAIVEVGLGHDDNFDEGTSSKVKIRSTKNDYVNGDGESQHFLFELIGDSLNLIIG